MTTLALPERWTFAGVDLSTYAIISPSVVGADELPPVRGDDFLRSGIRGRLYAPKVLDARRVALTLVVTALNAAGTYGGAAQARTNLDALLAVLGPRAHGALTRLMPDASTRTAQAECIAVNNVSDPVAHEVFTLTAQFALPDPVWYGASSTGPGSQSISASPTDFTFTLAGNVESNQNLTINFTGRAARASADHKPDDGRLRRHQRDGREHEAPDHRSGRVHRSQRRRRRDAGHDPRPDARAVRPRAWCELDPRDGRHAGRVRPDHGESGLLLRIRPVAMSDYLENKALDAFYGRTFSSFPATIYAQLHTGNPGEAGTANVHATFSSSRDHERRDALAGRGRRREAERAEDQLGLDRRRDRPRRRDARLAVGQRIGRQLPRLRRARRGAVGVGPRRGRDPAGRTQHHARLTRAASHRAHAGSIRRRDRILESVHRHVRRGAGRWRERRPDRHGLDHDQPADSAVSGLGATWTRVYQSTTTNGGNVQVWLGTGCNGSTSVITVTPSFSADWAAMASEWFAITDATANVDDINIAAAGALPTLSIGATYTYSFLIDALALSTSVDAATGLTAGWTALTAKTQGGTRAQGAYQRLPVPPGPSSPYTVGWTLNASQSYQHVVILFRGAPLAAVNGTATLAGVGVLRGTATGVIPINPLPLEVRVYAAANPLGPAIAVWNGQRGLQTHDEHNATGAGRLTLLVSDPKATPTNLAQYNLVRVFLGPFDVFDFWVETPDWTIASPDGGAGESVVVAGRGLEAYLERALVWLSGASFTARPPARSWASSSRTRRRAARCRSCARDFTNALDSAGVAWAGDLATITLSLTEGTDYLSVLGQLRQIGVIARMRADFTLQLFQSFGTNQKAAGVTLRQGRHFPGPSTGRSRRPRRRTR
jgi:hypothetical protein